MGIGAAALAAAGALSPKPARAGGDGYLAGIINFRYMANALWTTDDAVARIAARI